MLYLIKIDYRNREKEFPYSVLKVGYAEDIERRMKEYNGHNPCYTLLDTSEGTREDEFVFHKLFSDLKLPDRREWFEYSESIIEEFQHFKDHGTIRVPKDLFISLLKEKLKVHLYPNPYKLSEKYLDELKNEIKDLSTNNPEEEIKIPWLIELIWSVWWNQYNSLVAHLNDFDFSEAIEGDFVEILPSDISQDIPQIFGRQRLVENPWKNCATLYYRSTADYKKMSAIDFFEKLEKKIKKTNNLINALNKVGDEERIDLTSMYESHAKLLHYKEDYVSVTKGKVVFNNYAYVSEIRSYDIQQIDYADRFTVFSNVTSSTTSSTTDKTISDFLEVYKDINGKTWIRLQLLCDFYYEYGEDTTNRLLDNLQDVDPVKETFIAAGPDLCRTHSYHISKIKKILGENPFNSDNLNNSIYEEFKAGEVYSNVYIKTKLQEIFREGRLWRKGKSYFYKLLVRNCKIYNYIR